MKLYTGYEAAKVINAALEQYEVIDPKTGSWKVIPPQMIYTYMTKEYIPSTGKRITETDLQEWLQGYLVRNGVSFDEESETVDA